MITVVVVWWWRRNVKKKKRKRVVVQSRHVYPLPPSLSAGNLWRGARRRRKGSWGLRARKAWTLSRIRKKEEEEEEEEPGIIILYILIISLIPSYSSLACSSTTVAPAASLLLLLLLRLYSIFLDPLYSLHGNFQCLTGKYKEKRKIPKPKRHAFFKMGRPREKIVGREKPPFVFLTLFFFFFFRDVCCCCPKGNYAPVVLSRPVV